MSELDTALDQLYALEEALAITSPIEVGVKRAWPYVPPMSQIITDTPCFVHSWTLPELQIGSALMRETFLVNMRLLVHDADAPQAAKIASAFWPQIRTMFSQNVKLGLSGWHIGPVRGGDPTLTSFTEDIEGGGKTLIGLDLTVTLFHNLSASNAAGDPP